MKQLKFLALVLFVSLTSIHISRANNTFPLTHPEILNNDEGIEYDTLFILQYLTEKYFEGYNGVSYKYGDLNQDGIDDVVVVIERPCTEEDDIPEARCRKVVFWVGKGFRNDIPRFGIAATNDKIVDCSYCGGGGVGYPNQGIKIAHGKITFEKFYGGCYKTYYTTTFQYNVEKKDWFLQREESGSYSCRPEDNPDDGEINVSVTESTVEDFGVIRFQDYK